MSVMRADVELGEFFMEPVFIMRSMALEEGTGTEAMDAELLSKDKIARSQMKDQSHRDRNDKGDGDSGRNLLSDNKRVVVIYRMGQKSLVRRFLREAEMALCRFCRLLPL